LKPRVGYNGAGQRFLGAEIMGSMSWGHWLIVLAVVLLLFGAGKIPRLMGDFAKGIKAFKSGMKEGETDEAAAKPGDAPAQVPPPKPAEAQTTARQPERAA
jgi:sec-independent protein translocase protein TatA